MLLVGLVLMALHVGVEGILPVQEILALKDIFDSTNPESWNWGDASSGARWFSTSDLVLEMNPCNEGGMAWQGVRCSGSPVDCDTDLCSVIFLQLPNFNISGRFFHDSMANLTNLQVLNMFSNPALTGTIPTTLATTKLFYMDFTGCAVSGSLPAELGQLGDLWQLKFRDNSLTGQLPVELTRPWGLEVLELRGNYLTHSLPPEYSTMEALRVFDMKFNLLSGSIPNAYSRMIGLTHFELYVNKMTGTIPSSLGVLTNLEVLDFDFNDFDGTIPEEIGELTLLKYLYFYGNKYLSGSIPHSFGNLTELNELDMGGIALSGSIPSELGRLVNLKTLYLDDNVNLLGSIPRELGNLASIEILWMYDNQLTSTLPVELGNLSTVRSLAVYRNSLSGTIPAEFSSLTALTLLAMHANVLTGSPFSAVETLSSLRTLWLDSNLLTGSVSSSIGGLRLLTHLRLQNNLFSREFPSAVGHCSKLQLLELENNHFSGPIPDSLGLLAVLKVLKLSGNCFTGSVPFLGTLTVLEDVVLRANFLEGGAEFGLGELLSLEFLDMSANRFTGPLPVGLGNLLSLKQIYVQGNHFTGHLDEVFTQPKNMTVVNFDASDNRFSGSVPVTIFQIPAVQIIALSVNCFQGSLPLGMCSGREIRGVSMDGLGAAPGCPHTYNMPFTNIALFNKLEGPIPDCVFSMPKLQFLHLTGNGFTGTLAPLPPATNIQFIHIAHNQITSTIPISFQTLNFSELDLSFNKLTGEYKHPVIQKNAFTSIVLQINRLSGTLHTVLEEATKLNVLRDNIFGCQHLPHNDPNIERYSCGSTTLNDAYYLLAGVAVLVFLFVASISGMHVYNSRKRLRRSLGEEGLVDLDEEAKGEKTVTFSSGVRDSMCSSSSSSSASSNDHTNIELDFNQSNSWSQVCVLMTNIIFYLRYFELHLSASDDSLGRIQSYCREMKFFSMSLLGLSAICVITMLPILLLKHVDLGSSGSNLYVTHEHLYGWKNSLAFVTGELPAGLLLAAWTVSCSAFIFFVLRTLRKYSSHVLLRQRSGASLVEEVSGRMMLRNDLLVGQRQDCASTRPGVDVGVADATVTGFSPPRFKPKSIAAKMRRHVILTSIGLMLFNTCVVSMVNGLYIVYSAKVSASTEVVFQFVLAVFNVSYAIFVIPVFTLGYARHSDAINVRIWLLLVNSLVIPCIVTAITSPSCIQGIFVQPDEVTATYSYTPNCAITHYSHTGHPICTDTSDIVVAVAPLIPPFTYNYQCTSVLLTAYIPVFIYSYALQVAAPFIFLFILCFLKYTALPRYVRKVIPGVLFPDNWSKDNSENGPRSDALPIALSKSLYNVKTVTSTLIHNIIVLLTFGLCSPVLACLIGTASYLVTATWRVLLARFVHCRLSNLPISSPPLKRVADMDYALATMDSLAGEATGLIQLCLWPYMSVSAFFFLCVSWDMAGDRVGWRNGFWAPLVSLAVLCLMILAVNIFAWYTSPVVGDSRDVDRSSIELPTGAVVASRVGCGATGASGASRNGNDNGGSGSGDGRGDRRVEGEFLHKEVELAPVMVSNPLLLSPPPVSHN